MSLRKRSKEFLTAVRRIFEVNLNLRCTVKIMNSDGMAELKALTYYKTPGGFPVENTENVFFSKNSPQFFTGEKLSEMSEQLSITTSF